MWLAHVVQRSHYEMQLLAEPRNTEANDLFIAG